MSIQVIDLAVGRGASPTLTQLNFELPAGELVGLIGPNGAGKTSLLRALAGLDAPHAGQLPAISLEPPQLRRQSLAFLPQLAPPAPAYSVREFVLMASDEPLRWQAQSTAIERADDALLATDLSALAHRPCDRLSGGEYRRTLLAATLAQGASLLLLDEPCAGLDLPHAALVMSHLRTWLTGAKNRRVLVAMHDLNLTAQFCDQVLLLGEGELLGQDRPNAVLTPNLLDRAFGPGLSCFEHPESGQRVILAKGER
ncbi:MAG: cobalamin/Fe(3+)-siderophore ABC transporter ATP-binding protein [Myxococcales bacterium]|nr:cobalamin/Fe(3+)-siderophore ABC transporter ATP-binding protein [Myxococcales bacterium]